MNVGCNNYVNLLQTHVDSRVEAAGIVNMGGVVPGLMSPIRVHVSTTLRCRPLLLQTLVTNHSDIAQP
jgi:hypothetical protein